MATLEALQQQVAALQATVDALTTPPSDYYTHRWSGEEIDNAVARSRTGGAIDTALSNKVSVEGGTISDTLNNAVLPGRWTVAVPSDAPGNPIQYPGGVLFGFLDVYAQSTWLMQVFSPAGTGEDAGYMYIRKNISNTGWTDWYRFATATPPQVHEIQLAPEYTEEYPCVYYKDQSGRVTVSGTFSGNISTGNWISTLPEGFRPNGIIEVPAAFFGNSYTGSVYIRTDGAMFTHMQSTASTCSFFMSYLAAN